MTLVAIDVVGPVCTLTMTRNDKLNAIDRALHDDLSAACESPEVRACRAVVLTGDRRAFSAGADLAEMETWPAGTTLRETLRPPVHERLTALDVPTVSAIQGYCLGGGLELALATDIRVADAGATLGLPEVGLGTIPSWGGVLRLVRLIGEARARELVLLGTRLSAQKALEMGLVTEVVTDGSALTRAQEIASHLAALPADAVLVARRLLTIAAEASFQAGALAQVLGAETLAARFVPEPS